MIAKYGLGIDGADGFTRVVGIAHGWLYVVYLVFAFDLGSKAKWPFGQAALGAARRARSPRPRSSWSAGSAASSSPLVADGSPAGAEA